MKRITGLLTKMCTEFLPDALAFCLILTLVLFCAALSFTTHTSLELIGFWGDGLWNLNSFSMQMVMILLLGHLIATSKILQKMLQFISHIPKTSGQGLIFLSLISLLACWLNWGFGLIVAGSLAVAFSQRFPKLHFGVLLATGYSGFLIWHGGLSGSIPLSVAGEDQVMKSLGLGSISLKETIFSTENLWMILGIFILFPITSWFMRKSENETEISLSEKLLTSEVRSITNFREWMENSAYPLKVLGILVGVYILVKLNSDFKLQLNSMNSILFGLSFFLYPTIRDYISALQKSVVTVAPLLIQYPLYAGIMSVTQSSGLGEQISRLFVSWATPETFEFWCFMSAGVVNFFVPSGGGQWLIQGPIMLKAANTLGVSVEKTILAISWGDAWTNLVQPFFALPILAMAKRELKDMMSASFVYFVVSGIFLSLMMLT
jgi:short-chain fatty acids transporter